MIKLNIIPLPYKNEIKLKEIYRSIINLLYTIIIIVILYAILFQISKLILQINFIKTINETTFITRNSQNFGNKARDINNQITFINKIQSGSVDWVELLNLIGKNTNDDVKFSQIKINQANNTILLTGNAGTRESLIKLKESFEKFEFMSDINFPIKNLLEKNNINFEISAKINTYDFN